MSTTLHFDLALADASIQWSPDDLSPVTERKYRSYLKRLRWEVPLVDDTNHLLPPDAVRVTLAAWRQRLERQRKHPDPAERISASKIATERSALHKFYAALVEKGVYPSNPMTGIKGATPPDGEPRPIPMEWVHRLFAAPDATTLDGLRDLVMLHLYLHALRVGEVCALRVGDLRWDAYHGELTLRLVGTSRRAREDTSPPLKPDTMELLAWYLVRRFLADDEAAWRRQYPTVGDVPLLLGEVLELLRDERVEPLFVYSGHKVRNVPMPTREAERVFARLREGAGLPARDTDGIPIGPHALRHTILTEVLRATDNLRTTQTIARHRNIKHTQRYTGVSDRQKATALSLVAFPTTEAVWKS